MMKELSNIRFFAVWFITLILATATLAPLVSALAPILR